MAEIVLNSLENEALHQDIVAEQITALLADYGDEVVTIFGATGTLNGISR